MFVGLVLLRPAFVGRAARWWTTALLVQTWHLFEHLLLLGQAMIGRNLGGAAQPTSILQLVIPRLELHLFYNTVVLLPMVIAMVYHVRPSADERRAMTCRCADRAPAHPGATLVTAHSS
jgi:hypothetical protein